MRRSVGQPLGELPGALPGCVVHAALEQDENWAEPAQEEEAKWDALFHNRPAS